MFTLVYLCLPLFTCVYLCLLMFTYICHVYSCMFTNLYQGLLVFTCLHFFTCVYPVYACYLCLPLFSRVYLGLSVFSHACLPTFTPVYWCLPMFTFVYLCLFVFTFVYHCLPSTRKVTTWRIIKSTYEYFVEIQFFTQSNYSIYKLPFDTKLVALHLVVPEIEAPRLSGHFSPRRSLHSSTTEVNEM